MAARHMQKLRSSQLAAVNDAPSISEEQQEENVRAPFNPFDLLSDEEVSATTSLA